MKLARDPSFAKRRNECHFTERELSNLAQKSRSSKVTPSYNTAALTGVELEMLVKALLESREGPAAVWETSMYR